VPEGYGCCDGDVVFPITCTGGLVSCTSGGRLQLLSQCTTPPPPPPPACDLPNGYECCDGDEVFAPLCTDAGAVCPAGSALHPSYQCTLPIYDGGGPDAWYPPSDAGPDVWYPTPADAGCGGVVGFTCCGTPSRDPYCGPDGMLYCPVGTTYEPASQCTVVQPVYDAATHTQ
jgi:hypothetical protein